MTLVEGLKNSILENNKAANTKLERSSEEEIKGGVFENSIWAKFEESKETMIETVDVTNELKMWSWSWSSK